MEVVEVERYDPYNQSWCAISPALKYVSNFAATGCLGKLYLVGSCAVKYNALTLQCYNPVRGERRLQRHESLGSDGEHVMPACLAALCPFQLPCKEPWGWGCFFLGGGGTAAAQPAVRSPSTLPAAPCRSVERDHVPLHPQVPLGPALCHPAWAHLPHRGQHQEGPRL